jgi:choline dehydrogenase-like flavoprotein
MEPGHVKLVTGEDAVVDTELPICGIDGLRVVDASVMPSIPVANTNATVLAIAERAAAMIVKHGRVDRPTIYSGEGRSPAGSLGHLTIRGREQESSVTVRGCLLL